MVTIPAKPSGRKIMLKSAGYFFYSGNMSYSKPALTYQQQLDLLKSRGLTVGDEAAALHNLEHHNYYRLSAYRFTLSEPGNSDQFLPKTTFEDLWGLYCFDRQLRLLVMEAVKRLEVSVRAHWAYTLGHTYGPLAYENPAHFRNPRRHTQALGKVDDELRRSKEVFITHFNDQYGMSRPPIWAVSEVMSFGLLSRFYENLKANQDRKTISSVYGLSPKILESLLMHAAYVRNLCAHHSRLWNRRFTITVQVPRNKPQAVVASLNPAKDRQIYNTLVILAHIVDVVEPQNHWARRVRALVRAQRVPVIDYMGFPADWESRPIWLSRVE